MIFALNWEKIVTAAKKAGLHESKEELFESLLSEDIDDVYTSAYYRADRIVK